MEAPLLALARFQDAFYRIAASALCMSGSELGAHVMQHARNMDVNFRKARQIVDTFAHRYGFPEPHTRSQSYYLRDEPIHMTWYGETGYVILIIDPEEDVIHLTINLQPTNTLFALTSSPTPIYNRLSFPPDLSPGAHHALVHLGRGFSSC